LNSKIAYHTGGYIMTDKEKLDEAIEQLKSQMAKDKQASDWKKAYLNKLDIHKQSLNRSVTCLN